MEETKAMLEAMMGKLGSIENKIAGMEERLESVETNMVGMEERLTKELVRINERVTPEMNELKDGDARHERLIQTLSLKYFEHEAEIIQLKMAR